jgi:hypothetical protein
VQRLIADFAIQQAGRIPGTRELTIRKRKALLMTANHLKGRKENNHHLAFYLKENACQQKKKV